MVQKILQVMIDQKNVKIAIIGLGYVGLPLAVQFGKFFDTIGFDINQKRIQELNESRDLTLEVESHEFLEAKKLSYTHDSSDILDSNIKIVTVPTPIDKENKPDLSPLISASKTVGKSLIIGDIVIFESTVYPGLTEEICVPILEKNSGLKFNKDFFCGYSPERINPGDKKHKLQDIVKITSGSNEEVANIVDNLYKKIITAGTHKAKSIRVAEAAKVIENTQRDVNIALINEFALIFNKLGIDTEDVLKAAGTKWNFINFRPGLVGGHCIGIDPYYLTYKALEVGYSPEMILAGRRLNDNMGSYIVNQVSRLMTKKRINIVNSNILIMGFTFKENCPDIRNTGVANLVSEFESLHCNVEVYDPWVKNISDSDYNINLISKPFPKKYDVILIAVAHDEFKNLTLEKIKLFGKESHVLYDIKYLFDSDLTDGRL